MKVEVVLYDMFVVEEFGFFDVVGICIVLVYVWVFKISKKIYYKFKDLL